jgi:hypothetical protein
MIKRHKRFIARAVPLALGLGMAGFAISAGQAESTDAPLRCEIEMSKQGGMVAMQGVVHSDVAVSGSYRFRVASAGSGGNSNISQGGGFSADANDPVTLGNVMLGGGGSYDASLEVTANGETIECSERTSEVI